MQVALATDGVEWAAADMTFLINGLKTAILNRTTLWAGTGGVFTGGAVATVSGLTVSVSGPLKFQANGELGVMNAPANLTAAASNTNYVVAIYGTTDDTPASFYGGGSPPNLHRNDNPTVVIRTSGPAVLASGEVDLATVVTGVASITTITDTRIILPSVDAAGNLLVGTGKTIQGVNLAAHVAQVGNATTIGHLKLGAQGGATPYSVLGGAWLKEEFIDVGATFAATKVLDDADFTSPPASSQPFASGVHSLNTAYIPTRNGDLSVNGYGPRVCTRYTLTFTSTTVQQIAVELSSWDTTLRVRANGVQLTSQNAANGGTSLVLTFNSVIGTNTIQIYHGNVDGNQFYLSAYCGVLTFSGIQFTG